MKKHFRSFLRKMGQGQGKFLYTIGAISSKYFSKEVRVSYSLPILYGGDVITNWTEQSGKDCIKDKASLISYLKSNMSMVNELIMQK